MNVLFKETNKQWKEMMQTSYMFLTNCFVLWLVYFSYIKNVWDFTTLITMYDSATYTSIIITIFASCTSKRKTCTCTLTFINAST